MDRKQVLFYILSGKFGSPDSVDRLPVRSEPSIEYSIELNGNTSI